MSWRRSIRNKGQLSHTFAFLMAIIIIIATVILAMRLLGNLTDTACGASMGEFFSSLERELTASSSFGSRSTIDVASACGGEELCFVDSRDMRGVISAPHPEIQIAIQEEVEANIFLMDSDSLLERTYDERVILSSPDELSPGSALCINVTRGSFTMRTEGFGRYLSVAKP